MWDAQCHPWGLEGETSPSSCLTVLSELLPNPSLPECDFWDVLAYGEGLGSWDLLRTSDLLQKQGNVEAKTSVCGRLLVNSWLAVLCFPENPIASGFVRAERSSKTNLTVGTGAQGLWQNHVLAVNGSTPKRARLLPRFNSSEPQCRGDNALLPCHQERTPCLRRRKAPERGR